VVFDLLPPYRGGPIALYPFLLWGVVRFGMRGASAGLVLVSLITVASTLADRGPFAVADLPPLGDMRLAQFFLCITALSFLSLAAVIHERDRAARELGDLYHAVRQSERRLLDVVETMPTFAWTARSDGVIDFVNRLWRTYSGLSEEDALGACWPAAVHPADLDRHEARWRASLASGDPFEDEVRYRRGADGVYRWFLARAVPLRDERGAIVRWYGVSTDIDDRRRAEALLAGEKRILEMVARGESLAQVLDGLCRLVEEHADDVLASILLLDGDRLRQGAAPSLPRAYTEAIDGAVIGPRAGSCGTAAYRLEQVIVSDIATDPLWADYREAALLHALRACWSTPILSSDGAVIATFAMYYREPRSPSARDQSIIEQITHLAGVAIQRTRTEEELRKQAALLGLAHDAIIVRDLESRITFWNPGAVTTYGWAAGDAIGRVSHDLLQTRCPVSLAAVDAALQETGQWEGELTHITRQGTAIVVNSRMSLLRAARGVGSAILEINRDISERMRAEHLTRQVFERTPDAVCVVGRDYRYQRVNPVYERMQQIPAEGIVGMHVAELPGSDVFERTAKPHLDRCLAGEHVRYGEWFTTAAGRQYLSVSLSPLHPESDRVEAALVIIRDLTDHMLAVESLQAAQAELAHVTRVMTLGELAASIAHEVNQPLSAIVADASAALNWLEAPAPDLAMIRESLAAVVKDSHRAADVIQRIRQLATKSSPQKIRLDLGDVVRDVVALVRGELHRQEVSLTLDLAADLPLVRGDRVQLQQVFLNIAMNGIEAMAPVRDRPRELVVRSGMLGSGDVVVAVQDAGVGVAPETIEQLFSAFFTTKPGGMGMGLSISRSIVEAHGGWIRASANPTHGTTFEVVLPVTR
ncbi:MAG TPA: PAS domain S-box protein, partial [Candidatus Binatia bacterium]|nr:PAS domain S-box protein [Candidatus Binatia bacterium]